MVLGLSLCFFYIISAHSDSSASFLICIFKISFSYLISLARSYNTVLNKSGESGHPCLIPNLRKIFFSFPAWSMILAVGLSYMAYILLRCVSSVPTLLRLFIINGCWILWKAFAESIEIIMQFLFFSLSVCYITFVDF